MKGKQRGFTLAEMIATVAILGILLLLIVPSVHRMQAELRQRELDDHAREIFLSVQNQLIAQRADGTLEAPEADPLAARETLSHRSGQFEQGNYVVYYNPGTAMVLEAYYAEELTLDPATAGGEYGAGQEEARWGKVGYYNGDDVEYPEIADLKAPTLEILNGEDLRAVITVPYGLREYMDGIRLNVLLQELDRQGKPVPDHQVLVEDLKYTDQAGGRVEVVLDGPVDTDERFAKTYGDRITPGANLRVTAELTDARTAPNPDRRQLAVRISAETNSLFAARSLEEGHEVIQVANPRQLQNLEELVPAAGDRLLIRQTDSIDWPEGLAFRSIPVKDGWFLGYQGSGLTIDGLRGKNGLFSEITVEKGSVFSRLFGASEPVTLSGIRLTDPRIGATATAGALAGTITGPVTVEDCRAYRGSAPGETPTAWVRSTGAAGGLVGKADGVTFRDSFAALDEVEGSTAGGLAAQLTGCTAQSCYANTTALSGTAAGGFAGVFNGGSAENCYALGQVQTGRAFGFADGSVAAESCYCATSYVNGSAQVVYGFGPGANGSCAYLDLAVPETTDAAQHLTYTELKDFGGSDWTHGLSAASTHPYLPKLLGKAYPFPAVQTTGGETLSHYGNWPELRLARVFDHNDPADTDSVEALLVPLGGERTYYAQNYLDDRPIPGAVEVKALEHEQLLTLAGEPVYDKTTGRTAFTLEAKLKEDLEPEKQTGVTYVNLNPQEEPVRAITVVYQAELTMTTRDLSTQAGKSVGATVTNTTGTTHPQQEEDRETLNVYSHLETDNRLVNAVCEVKTMPDWNALKEGMEALGKEGKTTVRTTLGTALPEEVIPREKWEGVWRGDPRLKENPDRILILRSVDSPYSRTWRLYHTEPGRALLSASWAMDNDLRVECPVHQYGPRVSISRAIPVDWDSDARDYVHISPENPRNWVKQYPEEVPYPQQLEISVEQLSTVPYRPRPVSFYVTTELAGEPAPGGSYSWTIQVLSQTNSRDNIGRTVDEVNGRQPGDARLTISGEAVCRVTVTYTEPKPGGGTASYQDSVDIGINQLAEPIKVEALGGTKPMGSLAWNGWYAETVEDQGIIDLDQVDRRNSQENQGKDFPMATNQLRLHQAWTAFGGGAWYLGSGDVRDTPLKQGENPVWKEGRHLTLLDPGDGQQPVASITLEKKKWTDISGDLSVTACDRTGTNLENEDILLPITLRDNQEGREEQRTFYLRLLGSGNQKRTLHIEPLTEEDLRSDEKIKTLDLFAPFASIDRAPVYYAGDGKGRDLALLTGTDIQEAYRSTVFKCYLTEKQEDGTEKTIPTNISQVKFEIPDGKGNAAFAQTDNANYWIVRVTAAEASTDSIRLKASMDGVTAWSAPIRCIDYPTLSSTLSGEPGDLRLTVTQTPELRFADNQPVGGILLKATHAKLKADLGEAESAELTASSGRQVRVLPEAGGGTPEIQASSTLLKPDATTEQGKTKITLDS